MRSQTSILMGHRPLALSLELFSARGRCGDRRPCIAQRDPHVGVGTRLALDEPVAGLPPEQDALVLIVEDVVAVVGGYGKNSMTFVVLVTNYSHEQRLARPARLD